MYLDAWSYVRSEIGTTTPSTPTASAILSFANNWSNKEFVQFVDELGAIVDELGGVPGAEAWRNAERIWERVAELEELFWPSEEDVLDCFKRGPWSPVTSRLRG